MDCRQQTGIGWTARFPLDRDLRFLSIQWPLGRLVSVGMVRVDSLIGLAFSQVSPSLNIRSNASIHKGDHTASPGRRSACASGSRRCSSYRGKGTPHRQRTFLAAMNPLDWIAGRLAIARRTDGSGPKTYRRAWSQPRTRFLRERIFRNWNALDANAIVDTYSRQPGLLTIGTDPDEWCEGFEAASALWRVQFQELEAREIKQQVDVQELVAWREGTVGWIACQVRGGDRGKGSVPGENDGRLARGRAYWRVVQWHASLGMPNEESFGFEMTTDIDEILTMVQDELAPVGAFAGDGSVTIMFTDIEDSTALMESFGEQAWMELLDWHDGAVKQQTAVFGGSVVKGQGEVSCWPFRPPARRQPAPQRSNVSSAPAVAASVCPCAWGCTVAMQGQRVRTSSVALLLLQPGWRTRPPLARSWCRRRPSRASAAPSASTRHDHSP